MKREDLKKLNLTDEQIDSIMGLHGTDIESHKTKLTDLQTQFDAAQTQLTEANTAIEGFKKLKPEELQAAADEWKVKFEQAQKDHAAELVVIEFDKDFGTALTGAKVKYTNEVKARLKLDELKDDKGKFIAERFNEQVGKLKTDAVDLFESDKPTPKIITNTNNQPVITDAFEAALWKGAGIKPPEPK